MCCFCFIPKLSQVAFNRLFCNPTFSDHFAVRASVQLTLIVSRRIALFTFFKISQAVSIVQLNLAQASTRKGFENLFSNVHSHGDYLCQVSLKSRRHYLKSYHITRNRC